MARPPAELSLVPRLIDLVGCSSLGMVASQGHARGQAGHKISFTVVSFRLVLVVRITAVPSRFPGSFKNEPGTFKTNVSKAGSGISSILSRKSRMHPKRSPRIYILKSGAKSDFF